MRITSREHKVKFLFPDGEYIGTLTSTGVLQVTTVADKRDDVMLLAVPGGVRYPGSGLTDRDEYHEYMYSIYVEFNGWSITLWDGGFLDAHSSGVYESINVTVGVGNDEA